MTTVLDHSEPVARKQHQCCECGGAIGAGDRYIRQRNVGDDGPYVYKAHALCWALIDWSEALYSDGSVIEWDWKREQLREVFAGLAATLAPTTEEVLCVGVVCGPGGDRRVV